MRIAYIDSAIGIGGAEVLLVNLMLGIRKDQIEPLLFCEPNGSLAKMSGRDGVLVVPFPGPRVFSVSVSFAKRKFFNPAAILWDACSVVLSAWRLGGELRRANVDIVQTNSTFAHVYGGLAALINRIPCIWYFHDLVETGRLKGGVRKFWQFLADRLAQRVVCVSDAVSESLGFARKSTVIHAFSRKELDYDEIGLKAQLELSSHALLVGFIGRIAYSKGLDVLVKAASQVIAVNDAIHFVIIGEAQPEEKGYEQALMGAVVASELTSHWHWLGYRSNASKYFSQFDVFVLPSRREAFPLVLLEAARARRAVVASRVGGIPEIVEDGKTGRLVQSGDSIELAAAILALLESPENRVAFGLSAEQTVKERFSADRYFSDFEELYRTLVCE